MCVSLIDSYVRLIGPYTIANFPKDCATCAHRHYIGIFIHCRPDTSIGIHRHVDNVHVTGVSPARESQILYDRYTYVLLVLLIILLS